MEEVTVTNSIRLFCLLIGDQQKRAMFCFLPTMTTQTHSEAVINYTTINIKRQKSCSLFNNNTEFFQLMLETFPPSVKQKHRSIIESVCVCKSIHLASNLHFFLQNLRYTLIQQ